MATRNGAGTASTLPPGFVFVPEFVTPAEEHNLLRFVQGLEFRPVQMHGVTAKRRVKQFGWHYAFESFKLTPTDPIPPEFANIGERAAELAGIDPSEWAEALVIEYSAGAGIGWHRDAPAFGIVAGVSLEGSCRMRFQTGTDAERRTSAIDLPPRSIYLLTGEARTRWQHTIPSTRELRYSITFRTLRKSRDKRTSGEQDRPDGSD
jgi:DNA oxidative demethylase